VKCCNIKAGMLREPVEFQSQVKTDIGGGATTITYIKRVSLRGHFKPMSGSERLYAERLDATTRNRLVIRYRSDLTESDRVIIRGRAYQIRSIINTEFRNKFLEIDLDGGVAT
jgi:SPP1 family predicted phage head-tail adaptor